MGGWELVVRPGYKAPVNVTFSADEVNVLRIEDFSTGNVIKEFSNATTGERVLGERCK